MVQFLAQSKNGDTTRASRHPRKTVEEVINTLEQILSNFRSAEVKELTTLHGLVRRPDEIELEFSFGLNTAAEPTGMGLSTVGGAL